MPRQSSCSSGGEIRTGARQRALPSLSVAAVEALLDATASVPWERPVHAARLGLLRRLARRGELSVHVACGTDRLGFIDVALGLTTVVTDTEAAALAVLSQQFAELEQRLGPFAGSLQLRCLAAEDLIGEAGFAAGAVRHLTLQNLFNAHLHPAHVQPQVIALLLRAIADGGSLFVTASEAAVLARQAPIQGVRLATIGQLPGYYDEDVLMFQAFRTSQ
jgi:hypothetical protein